MNFKAKIDVYQRLYVFNNSERLTPAYIIKAIIYPDQNKMANRSTT